MAEHGVAKLESPVEGAAEQLAETGAKGKAGGVQRLPLLLFGLGIVLCVRIAVPFHANGVVFPADDFADTSTTLRQAQDMAQYRSGRGVSWGVSVGFGS